ncbi:MAG: DNA-binding protein HU [Chlamydiia bacterium]|nr:DNA-binding protein HU [Chlamydiia bacterium]
MNKQELIDALSDETGFTKADATRFLQAYTATVSKSLKKGKDIQLVGFGTFKVTKRKARKGRNPQTGEELKIPSRKVPAFRPGKALRDAVN